MEQHRCAVVPGLAPDSVDIIKVVQMYSLRSPCAQFTRVWVLPVTAAKGRRRVATVGLRWEARLTSDTPTAILISKIII